MKLLSTLKTIFLALALLLTFTVFTSTAIGLLFDYWILELDGLRLSLLLLIAAYYVALAAMVHLIELS